MLKKLKKKFKILTDKETLKFYSRDASLFEIFPKGIFIPNNVDDIKKIVKFCSKNKISLTCRAAGTDMSGGPINEEIIIDIKKLNKLGKINNNKIKTQPGVYYRDFDKLTSKKNLMLPSYPASRELCMLGGMLANNAGGEKSLEYGKTIDYVKSLKVILSDGNEYSFKSLNKKELNEKLKLKTFEGKIYKKIYNLINKNYTIIKKAKPDVSKNSSGYNLWEIYDKNKFDLTKLFIGSQGTLGIITEAELSLVKKKKKEGLVIIFLKDLNDLIKIIHEVLKFKPVSFESYDDKSLKLAIKYFPSFLKLMKVKNLFSLAIKFLPEFFLTLTFGIPRLTLLVEFEEDSEEILNKKINSLLKKLDKYPVKKRGLTKEEEIRKYWLIRRESFNLLRNKIKGKQTAPFIDDFIVKPELLKIIFPKLIKILDKYNLDYTIIGHMGNGNFHIIPLMDLSKKEERDKVPKLSKEFYDLILKFKGSITAEHNDGLARSPYLEKMYGKKVYSLFEDVKEIFDKDNIFNPGKKVNSSLNYALKHIKRS